MNEDFLKGALAGYATRDFIEKRKEQMTKSDQPATGAAGDDPVANAVLLVLAAIAFIAGIIMFFHAWNHLGFFTSIVIGIFSACFGFFFLGYLIKMFLEAVVVFYDLYKTVLAAITAANQEDATRDGDDS